MRRRLQVAVLEPYYGGSHAAFIETWRRHSRHELHLAMLPARKWKWRMRGAAVWFAQTDSAWTAGGSDGSVDVIFCTDMLSVADLRSLLPKGMTRVPIVCYFHENQLTYPIPEDQERDFQYGMTNITSCLAADAVWFNSKSHLDDFLDAVGGLLRKMPDFVPPGIVDSIRAKSSVSPPPVDVPAYAPRPGRPDERPLTLLWPHRWEYDKNPEPFFDALIRLDGAGHPFHLVMVGEQFRTAPPSFASSWERLRNHIIRTGFISDRREYLELLAKCDVVVSTAVQETFGIAVVEAILAGCQPLLPDRLSYPELIPPNLHDACLYPVDDALFDRLRNLVDGPGLMPANALEALRTSVAARYGVKTRVSALDDGLNDVVEQASTVTGRTSRRSNSA